MKKITLLFILFLSFIVSSAQENILNFTSIIHDFGKIKEEKGKVKHTFKFTNKTDKAIVITKVRTSCGCTTPSYSKKPIMPNQNGELLVAFNPRRRPGSFHKTITVSTNIGQQMLRIKGSVIPKPKTIKDEFPISMNGLRLKNNNISFVKITHNSSQYKTLEFINNSKKDINIEFINIPKHLKIKYPNKIVPKQRAILEIEYDAKIKNDWGFVIDYINLKVNNKLEKISVSANIVDEVKTINNAAKIKIDSKFINLGKMKKGAKIDKTMKIINIGKSNLYIRKIVTDNNNISYKISKKILKPNEEANLAVNIIAPNSKKSIYNKIQIITNDPTSWTTTIRFAMKVVD